MEQNGLEPGKTRQGPLSLRGPLLPYYAAAVAALACTAATAAVALARRPAASDTGPASETAPSLANQSKAPVKNPSKVANRAGVRRELAFETSDLMRHTAYKDPVLLNRDHSPTGAFSPVNRDWEAAGKPVGGRWFIEQQRYGGDVVCAGIAGKDTATIDRGLMILQWGLDRQEADGSFRCDDAFHSTSLFLVSASQAVLLLKASLFESRYRERIAAMTPKLLAAARWMTTPAAEERGIRNNMPYTHRRFLVATALGTTGILADDPALVARSEGYIRDALTLQNPDGYFPEKGGWDSSYNGVSLQYGARYTGMIAPDKSPLYRDLFAALKKGMAWQRSRVQPDGVIRTDGNTRVGATPERGRNGIKRVDYKQTYRAFARWRFLSGDKDYEKLALAVAEAASRPR